MSYTVLQRLPSLEELIQAYPLSVNAKQRIVQHQAEIKAILEGQDSRWLVIVGPCSAWPREAVYDYAERLLTLSEQVQTRIKLVMRAYIQKPRTLMGWPGALNQPDPFLAPNIVQGLHYTRQMMVRLVEMGLALADEALFINSTPGFLDLLSWVAIGARSSENPEHRIFASALESPVGMKNPTHGALSVAVNSVVTAQQPQVMAWDGKEIQTHGNPYAHLVLRGANQRANYELDQLQQAQQLMALHGVKNSAVLVDASHDNSVVEGKKDYRKQVDVILNVLESVKLEPSLQSFLKGFMLESFLKAGHQKLEMHCAETVDRSGLSITDPCLSWETTRDILLELAVN